MKNEIINNIITRRSVKKYKSEMIPKDIIDQIVEAGSFAPSGMNKQSPIIVVVTNKKIRDQLSKLNASILKKDNIDPFYGAPVVCVVLANRNVPTYQYDGSLVMENLMLAAHSFGIGSCWIHRAKEMFDTKEGKQILKSLGIDDCYEGIANCILGYSDEMPKEKQRKENYIYYVS